jgi:LuxR family maltose regulon positive regulatory protein
MQTPLLASRLDVPNPPPGLLVRSRLFLLLNHSTIVTVVRAPAGWGKSVLLTSWLHTAAPPDPVAWLSIEPGDNAGDFWGYLHAALRRTAPAARFPRLGGGPDRRHLNQLAEALIELPRPLVLVVDAADNLRCADVERDLDFLLQHAMGKLRLVAACRGLAPVPVHLWRVRGELTEIGPADLVFTAAETAELLTRLGIEVPAGDVDLMQDQSEGWPAGVRMAAVAAQHDATGRPGQVGDAYVYQADYLTREVLAEQPALLQDVLLDTVIADRLCGGLVEAMTLRADGDQLLRHMLDAGLFLIPLESEPGCYRYHSLFARVMRSTSATRHPARTPVLHRRAATWFAEHDLPMDALQHAVAGEDWAVAEQVLTDRWCEIVGYDYSRQHTPSSPPSHAALPPEPEAALACALERLSRHDPDAAARYIRHADEQLTGLPAERQHRLRLITAALDLMLAGQRAALTDQGAAALRMLDLLSSGGIRDADEGARAIALTALGRVHLAAGELEDATVALGNGLALATRSGLPGPQLAAASALAVVQAIRGQLYTAERIAHTALAMPAGSGARATEDAHAHMALAIANLNWDRLDRATVEIQLALAAIGQANDPGLAASVAIVCAELMRERGELSDAMDTVRAARHEAGAWSVPAHLLHWLDATEAEVSTDHGDAAAARLVLLAGPTTGDADSARRAVALTRTYLRDGDPVSAADAVGPWASDHVDTDCPASIRLDAALLQAIARHRTGDRRGSTQALEHVLALAEPDGFRRPFTRGGQEVHEMLLAHLDSGTAYWSLVTNLVTVGPDDADAGDRAQLLEPLSGRELTVLRYLQSILSNAEIAAELSISVNTVKTHVRNIYRKLDTGRRRDAVRQARRRQLL